MVRFALIAALSAATACAQQSGIEAGVERAATERASQLLQSPSLDEKAWGAYAVGRYGLQDRAAELVVQLESLRGAASPGLDSTSPEYSAIQAMLDGLIRLRFPVEAATLLPFQKRWPAEVLILLGQNVKTNRDVLLAMTEQQISEPEWLAVHNLLVEKRSPGIAAHILSQAHIRHVFYVADSGGEGFGGGTGGGGAADGMLVLARDFPPIGVYRLILRPQGDDVMLAPGPHPVYYRRFLIPTGGQVTFGLPIMSTDHDQDRQEYLAQLTYCPLATVEQALAPATTIVWTDAPRYTSQVGAAIARQRGAIEQLVNKLQSLQLLTPDENSALQLTIYIEPDDRRKAGGALPDLPPVPLRGATPP